VGRRCIDSRTCDASCQKSVEERIVALSTCIEQHGESRIAGAGVLSAHCGVDSRPEESWPGGRHGSDKANAEKTMQQRLTYGQAQESRWYSGMGRVDVVYSNRCTGRAALKRCGGKRGEVWALFVSWQVPLTRDNGGDRLSSFC
jgi:hypothetical protein